MFTATMDSTQTVLPPTQVFLDISTDSRYTPYGFILYEDRYIFSYVPRKHLKGNRVKLILGNSGSSSTVLSYPIIRHMVETFEQQGAQCDFYYNYSSKSFAIYPYVFPNRTHILFHPDAKIYPVMHLLKKEIHTIGQYGDVRHMILTQNNFISKETEGHIVKEMMAMAGYERKLNVYEQFLLTPEKAKDQHTTSPYLINAIQQQCLRYRYIIGVQFESISDFEHIHDQDSIIKKWPSSSAEKFIHLCKAQGICICSLSRLNRDYDNVIGVGHLSIGELFGLIRHLDLVLGVDSICCYIASILRIPNISIWRYTLPYVDQTPNGGANLSLRPPCANHSIIIQDGDIAGIDPNRFLNAVLHLLANPETVLSRPFENPLPHEEW